MIKTMSGSALDAPRGFIIHGCNCKGVMGGGFALAVRNQYPLAYETYLAVHKGDGLKLGEINFAIVEDIKHEAEAEPVKVIVNAMTQDDMGNDRRYVDYEAVAKAFERVTEVILPTNEAMVSRGWKPLPLVFPTIGAGLARGNWKIIETIIDQTVPDSIEKILYQWEQPK